MSNVVLNVDKLNKSYGETQVLFNCSFDVKEGELVSIIGPSGAGKSTLLRCINRMTEPNSGSVVEFEGENVVDFDKKKLRETRKRIGMIFQHYNLVYRLTAMENVLHGRLGNYSTLKGALSLYNEEDVQKANDILHMLGLDERKFFKCSQLSGGQKQRVGIARALIQDPMLILCDEPISSLDPQSSKVIMEYLRKIKTELEIPCLVNLHQVEIAKNYSDRIIGMYERRIVFNGPPEELTDSQLEVIYGAKIDEILA